MVHRRLTALTALALVALGLLAAAGPASADNRRIAISGYAWSDSEIELDLGEHVTWYWTGPDTLHSVTGTNDAAAGLDSDPGTIWPDHSVGDEFRLDFEKAGTYEFQCKLHSLVKGTVEVSNTPGDPVSEPDPVPRVNVDLEAPNLRDVALASPRFGRKGTGLRYSLNERARLAVEIFALRPGKRPRFAGYTKHKDGHVGFNSVRFGSRRKSFPARPGRYLARVTATDRFANTTRPQTLRFEIRQRRR